MLAESGLLKDALEYALDSIGENASYVLGGPSVTNTTTAYVLLGLIVWMSIFVVLP